MIEQQRRRLLRHGFVFLFLALWLGLAIMVFPRPMKWMVGHLTALLTAVILLSVGHAWRDLALTARQRTIAFWCGLVGAYDGFIANIWSAAFNIPGPATSPGELPTGLSGAVFLLMFLIVVVTLMVGFGMLVYGMRGETVSDSKRVVAV
jgi:hypothetical protein